MLRIVTPEEQAANLAHYDEWWSALDYLEKQRIFHFLWEVLQISSPNDFGASVMKRQLSMALLG